MTKNFDKIIPFSDIITENDGGTLTIDLSFDDSSRIIKKIKNYNFDKDAIKIEQQVVEFRNELIDSNESFSFDILTTSKEKRVDTIIIKLLSLLKVDGFNYQNSKQENFNIYNQLKKFDDTDKMTQYYRYLIFYLGQENCLINILIDKDGLFKKKFELEEYINNLYEIRYENKNILYHTDLEKIILFINDKLKNTISQHKTILTKNFYYLCMSLILVPILLYYLSQFTKLFNKGLYKVLDKIIKYLNIDETNGLTNFQKKMFFGSSILLISIFKLKSYIDNCIDHSYKLQLSHLLFPEKIDIDKKKYIINFYEQIESFELIVKEIIKHPIKSIIELLDSFDITNSSMLNYYNKIILKILKNEIRVVKQLNDPCSLIIKKILDYNLKIPVFFFINKSCNLKTKLECIAGLMYSILQINKINIITKFSNKIDGKLSGGKPTIKRKKLLKSTSTKKKKNFD